MLSDHVWMPLFCIPLFVSEYGTSLEQRIDGVDFGNFRSAANYHHVERAIEQQFRDCGCIGELPDDHIGKHQVGAANPFG